MKSLDQFPNIDPNKSNSLDVSNSLVNQKNQYTQDSLDHISKTIESPDFYTFHQDTDYLMAKTLDGTLDKLSDLGYTLKDMSFKGLEGISNVTSTDVTVTNVDTLAIELDYSIYSTV